MIRALRVLLVLAAMPLLSASDCGGPPQLDLNLDGLEHPVRVRFDGIGVPHVFAETDTDMALVQGFLHARERFWKMDITRREVDGTLSELFGDSRLGDDIQMRAFGLHRAADRSLAALTARELEVLDAYADGANQWIAQAQAGTAPLPPEYAALELSAASLREWTAADTLTIGKGIAASLSLDVDAGVVENVEGYCNAGGAASPPFDGAALLCQDVQRLARLVRGAWVAEGTGAGAWSEAPTWALG
jgi:penicillin amidase